MVKPTEQPEGGSSPDVDPDATIVVQEKGSLPTIPGYELTRHIGAGGMAHVWLAIDDNLKRQVALKTMSLDLSGDASFDQRFVEEAQIVAGFRHSNIVAVFARGHTEDQHYIAMEYIAGGTLSDRLAKGVVPHDEAIGVAQAMADALAYSHTHDIIHRDFKPGNILFTNDGTPVLSDFGIAKSIDRTDPNLTVPGAIIGSPKYMAPEQKLGMPLTSKVDIYALGLVFFEMLVGTVPPMDVAIVRGAEQADGLAELLPSDCADVAGVIADCLQENPEKRPTGAEVAELLGAVLQPPVVKTLGGRILGAVGIAGLIGAVLFNLFADPKYDLQFRVAPEVADLYVDGQLLAGTAVSVGPGLHQVLVVEPGHYGQVLMLDATNDTEVPIELEPIDEPTFGQFEVFNRLWDEADAATIAGVEMTYEPYRLLLKLKEYQVRGDTGEIALMVADLNALAKVGDPAAQLMLFVANFDMVISGDRLSGLVQQASNSGYGLATYYQALHYRWSRERNDELDLTSLQVYRGLMALAEEQGLGFARMFVEEADGVLRGS